MRKMINVLLSILILLTVMVFPGCGNTHTPDIFIGNSLSIFLLNNGNNYFLCMPVQYIGEYNISGFKFNNGSVTIGDIEIQLNRNELNIIEYMSETADESGNVMNKYDIFIERILTDNEMKSIKKEYKKGNINCMMSIWYDITVDNEEQTGNGMLDDFELHNEFAQGAVWVLPHFELFCTKYLQK